MRKMAWGVVAMATLPVLGLSGQAIASPVDDFPDPFVQVEHGYTGANAGMDDFPDPF